MNSKKKHPPTTVWSARRILYFEMILERYDIVGQPSTIQIHQKLWDKTNSYLRPNFVGIACVESLLSIIFLNSTNHQAHP